jgi:hypothetical protein
MNRNPPATITVHVPLRFTVRGGRKTIMGQLPQPIQSAPRTRFDDAIVKAIARAHRWRSLIEDGNYASIRELAMAEKINESYVCRILRLTLLSPKIVEALLDPAGTKLTVETLTTRSLPIDWQQQHVTLRSG